VIAADSGGQRLISLGGIVFWEKGLEPQIQKTHRLFESEKKSAGFLNLWENTNTEAGRVSMDVLG
jgi:hypothetical protein